EDHVSMGIISAQKAGVILENVRKVLAIELVCAAQGLDFRVGNYLESGSSGRLEPAPGIGVKVAYLFTQRFIQHLFEDREIHKDLQSAVELLSSGNLLAEVKAAAGSIT